MGGQKIQNQGIEHFRHFGGNVMIAVFYDVQFRTVDGLGNGLGMLGEDDVVFAGQNQSRRMDGVKVFKCQVRVMNHQAVYFAGLVESGILFGLLAEHGVFFFMMILRRLCKTGGEEIGAVGNDAENPLRIF